MQEYAELNGTIRSVIYSNDENGYAVLRVETDSGETQTVVGGFPCAAPGEMISAEGVWTTHAQHGKQFKAEQSSRLLPTNADGIYEYLAGGSVRGIGPATAALIVERFGEKSLDVLELHPEKIAEIKGIGLSKAKQMSGYFKRQAGVRRLMEFLCAYKLRPMFALRLYKFYGKDALSVVQENPYILAASHIGASFAEADSLALELGLDSGSVNRAAAAVSFELQHNAGNGHCFIPRSKLAAATAQLIGVDSDTIEQGIEALIDSGEIVCDKVAGLDACYLSGLYEAETFTAARIREISTKKYSLDYDTGKLINRLENANGISYAPQQRSTLELALRNQIIVITGGPGTGKTTIVKAIIKMLDELEIETLLAAPTGRAAKRMAELTGADASTIHRMLGAKLDESSQQLVFTKDEEDPLRCDALIVDECSMVDIQLMYALLKAMKKDCRLILVGDADQLPSVGPGCVFSDIIRSGIVPTVRLTEIFRQSEDSLIVRNAHMINKGEHPDFNANKGGFFRLKRLQAAGTVETIVELCTKRLPEKMGIPSNQIQVLTPTRKGETGTAFLNKRLQDALNPAAEGKREKMFGETVFRMGDRVMQIRNNYDVVWVSASGQPGTGVFNGDVGVIIDIDLVNELLRVDFEDKIAVYGFELLNELEHAWAMTVHKSQGSEYRAVILALNSGSPMLMTRGVLYTALTRAKELLIMVGDEAIAHSMIDNHRQSRRYSALRIRLVGENL